MTATNKPARRAAAQPPIPELEIEEGEDSGIEAIEEAESELGINDWIDPETGEPAEGQSPPHLDED